MLQYMVVYQCIVAEANTTAFFVDGSSLSTLQVGVASVASSIFQYHCLETCSQAQHSQLQHCTLLQSVACCFVAWHYTLLQRVKLGLASWHSNLIAAISLCLLTFPAHMYKCSVTAGEST